MKSRKASILVLAGALVALLVAGAMPGLAHGGGATHKPPYKQGPQGGDSANFIYSDPASGTVGILRMYPVYNPFTCSSSKGGFVSLRVLHTVTGPVKSVQISYSNAAVDPYSFLTASVKQKGEYLGSKEVRGPLGGSGKINVPLSLGKARKGAPLTIDFGAEVSSACPNADGVTAQFTQIVVHGA